MNGLFEWKNKGSILLDFEDTVKYLKNQSNPMNNKTIDTKNKKKEEKREREEKNITRKSK
jgi:hypothetical protein